MKFSGMAIFGGLMILVLLSCRTLPVKEEPAQDLPRIEIQRENKAPDEVILHHKEEPRTTNESELISVSILPNITPSKSGTPEVFEIPPPPELSKPLRETVLPESGAGKPAPYPGDFSSYVTANDLDPEEPDHYYLRKKPAPPKKEPAQAEIDPENGTTSGQAASISSEEEEEEKITEDKPRAPVAVKRETKTVEEKSTSPPEAHSSPDFKISAAKGEAIQISLPDHSWIFDRKASEMQGLEFRGIQYLHSSKEFLFQAFETGEFKLSFSRPDLNTGSFEKRLVAVRVSEIPDTGVVKSGEEGSLGADSPEESGEQAPGVGIANVFSRESLKKGLNLKDEQSIGRQIELLVSNFPDAKSSVEWPDVLKAAEELEGSPYEAATVEVLLLFLERAVGRFEDTGRVYFLLGQIYESPQAPRDENIAVEYYRRVLEIFPADIYHFKAEERIKYLERHFLQIR